MPTRSRIFAYGCAMLAVAFWGVSFVATKVALRDLSPLALVFSRFALGSCLLVGLLKMRGQPLIPPRDSWPSLALLAFVGIFVHQLLQSYGLTKTSATHAGWLIALIPAWSTILAVVFLKESLNFRQAAGLVVGFCGAILLVGQGATDEDLLRWPTSVGDLLILASTFNWAVYTVIGRETLKRLGSALVTAWSMILGVLMLLPFFVQEGGWQQFPSTSLYTWIAILFLGIGCSGIAYLCWFRALAHIETTRVTVFLYFEPLVTVIAAATLLREPIVAETVIAGLLILAGLLLVNKSRA